MTLQVCPRKEPGRPKIVLGGMEFGRRLNYDDSKSITVDFIKKGYKEIDVAYMYQGGKSEKYLGLMEDSLAEYDVKFATKVNPRYLYGLSNKGINVQFHTSLDRMSIKKCDILYLHFPEYHRPIFDILKSIDDLYKEGLFERFGLSNFSAWQVAEIYYLCDKHNFIKPSVYQGLYNAISRDIEMELMPCLRRFGIKFYAYNIIAGGILSGKHNFTKDTNQIAQGRFNKQGWAKIYRERFWNQSTFDAVKMIQDAITEVYGDKLTILQASIMWCMNHSVLGAGDGVIMGPSKLTYYEQNLVALENKEPLHAKVLNAFEQAWKYRRGKVPSYVGNHWTPEYSLPVPSKL
mmetsp:Transcript_41894/g.51571  ORF Transcript_41894/g.51571 Transcript_41894/m.51571 type:complete len:347 (+) Transcript_41894:20-1060(+)